MLTLLLLRHAKSSWDNANLSDHDRPLNPRGLRDAPRMGELLESLDLVPNLILSSTAQRAMTTAQIVEDAISETIPIELDTGLYHASPEDCLRVAGERVSGEVRRLLLVAHNPGMEELIEALTGAYEGMPTAALALIECPCDAWDELRLDGASTLVHIYRPKEIK